VLLPFGYQVGFSLLFVSRDWEWGGRGSVAGLVPAMDAAIHTTQVQVDEVTVIRLSPIVYNKELVKTELFDQMTLLSPSAQGHQ
jgi:hypothetical protein